MNFDIPERVVFDDGTTAEVKAITAKVFQGRIAHVMYTVEKSSGAWIEVDSRDVRIRATSVAP